MVIWLKASPTTFVPRVQVSLTELCEKLELGDRSQDLIQHLLSVTHNTPVTFDTFKEGLVDFLALSRLPATPPQRATPPTTPPPAPPTPPRQGREMAPRFVYRNKKYGRKSRPSSVDTSDNEEDKVVNVGMDEDDIDKVGAFFIFLIDAWLVNVDQSENKD